MFPKIPSPPNVKITFEHYRISKDDPTKTLQRYYPSKFKTNFTPIEKGGATVCTIETDTLRIVRRADCSSKDNFCYKTGREIAFGRARKAYETLSEIGLTNLDYDTQN